MKSLFASKTVQNALGGFILTTAVVLSPVILEGKEPTEADFAAIGAGAYALFATVKGRVTATETLKAPKLLGGRPDPEILQL